MRRRNIIASLVLFAFGLTYGYFTSGLPVRSLPNTPGPPFFPWIVTIILLALSAALLIQSLTGAGDSADGVDGTANKAAAPYLRKRIHIGAVWALAAFVIYLALLPKLGFVLATAPFFAVLMSLFGERRWWLVAIGAIGATALLYFIFRHGFNVFLPRGILKDIIP
jgi:putative tricarboxylic transport membrane protein